MKTKTDIETLKSKVGRQCVCNLHQRERRLFCLTIEFPPPYRSQREKRRKQSLVKLLCQVLWNYINKKRNKTWYASIYYRNEYEIDPVGTMRRWQYLICICIKLWEPIGVYHQPSGNLNFGIQIMQPFPIYVLL